MKFLDAFIVPSRWRRTWHDSAPVATMWIVAVPLAEM